MCGDQTVVDGGNLAPKRVPKVLYFSGVKGLKVVQDVLHENYKDYRGGGGLLGI